MVENANALGVIVSGISVLQLARAALRFWHSPSDAKTKAAAERTLKEPPQHSSTGTIANAAAALGGLLGLSSLVSEAASSVLERSKGVMWVLAAYGAYKVYQECQKTDHPGGNRVIVHVHINNPEKKQTKAVIPFIKNNV